MPKLNTGMQKDLHTPADFVNAYEYLEYVELNKQDVDWTLLQHDPDTFTDVMLLRIMHLAKSNNGL